MLTELQLEEFRKCIERELGKIYEVIARPGDGSDSNELDQTKVGRLSRMDAMQQQAMNSGILDRLLVKKSRLEAALIRLDNDEFGFCCAVTSSTLRAYMPILVHLFALIVRTHLIVVVSPSSSDQICEPTFFGEWTCKQRTSYLAVKFIKV